MYCSRYRKTDRIEVIQIMKLKNMKSLKIPKTGNQHKLPKTGNQHP